MKNLEEDQERYENVTTYGMDDYNYYMERQYQL
jgi:hypothetical protein